VPDAQIRIDPVSVSGSGSGLYSLFLSSKKNYRFYHRFIHLITGTRLANLAYYYQWHNLSVDSSFKYNK
jgi:hypothetical protein